ncbi:non-hydrolyzing UDP-N-acetylglucosamine 2-epimerase [Sunxiuqinia elliptica]|uniref:UDP-N-acetylglucosamine 2-epimerase (non-hydrolyzing) n=1 Tax=Sunxiuqinia elliptica TaxID=655355 RepID=A0A4R6GQH7_9BACT|nr:UDP-N-acetylglucosamine 2-epimerase (non-hydrolyzing) [Sunxiuqinia elliptica]TDN96804.1 UDP-N-acetylglucosamine 2-epimerase [Sunxiuqinia elliptica]TDO55637.1 UDP-N-acetylglucosamine 2-epimerase [Sunxiuqinia elliptica]
MTQNTTTKKRILLVFGTRPEAIKMAPLVKAFEKHPDQFETLVCVTGQHREMLDQVLQLFEIKPQYDLNIMKAGQDLYDVTSRVLLGMRDVLKEAQPDLVLVHGDTATSTTAALAAFYQQIPVGHIEAGLRTHNIYSPWPEEMNRQLTGRLASYHFSPTPLSKQNLLNEGVKEENIHITGNTVIDALFWVIDKMKKDETLEKAITEKLVSFGLPSEKLQAWTNLKRVNSEQRSVNSETPSPTTDHRKLVLITGHRRENFGQGFINMCEAIKELAEQHPNVDFVYPMHLNPNVRKAITQVFGSLSTDHRPQENVHFIEPLDYLPFVHLMSKAYLVLTDSGGIQEEAPGLGKPVLVMRDTTERPEAIQAGTVKLVGTDKDVIIREVSDLINKDDQYEAMSKANNPYGDGKACERVVEALNK